jgi:pilus assembly protein CpaE
MLKEPKQVLVVGAAAATVQPIVALLQGQSDVQVSARVTALRPLAEILRAAPTTDVVVVCSNDREIGDLEALAALDSAKRPAVIVCGSLTTPAAMRTVVRAGASDLLAELPSSEELLTAVARAPRRALANGAVKPRGSLTVVMGAAGGAGSSFIACNLAHLSAAVIKKRTLLIDLDLIYASQAQFLALKPSRGIAEAAQQVANLDAVALDGYVTKHRSGLGLLARSEGTYLHEPVDPEAFRSVLRVALEAYETVFVDGHRWLDALTTVTVAEADHLVLVMEQSIAHVNNMAQLYRILTQQLGVTSERIVVVMNRYDKHAAVQPDMVVKAVGCREPFKLPNMYALALDSTNTAIPLFEMDAESSVTRGLLALCSQIYGTEPPEPNGIFRRTLAALSTRSHA